MENNNTSFEQVFSYFEGEYDATQKEEFLRNLETDDELNAEYEKQKAIREAVERIAIRNQVQAFMQKKKLEESSKKDTIRIGQRAFSTRQVWSIAATVVFFLVAGVWVWNNQSATLSNDQLSSLEQKLNQSIEQNGGGSTAGVGDKPDPFGDYVALNDDQKKRYGAIAQLNKQETAKTIEELQKLINENKGRGMVQVLKLQLALAYSKNQKPSEAIDTLNELLKASDTHPEIKKQAQEHLNQIKK